MRCSYLLLFTFTTFLLNERPAHAWQSAPDPGELICVTCPKENSDSPSGNHGSGGGHGNNGSRSNPGRDALNRGKELFDQGNWWQAENAFRTEVSYWPKDPQAHQNLGAALYQERKYDEAYQEFLTALRLEPKSGESSTWAALATTEWQQGYYATAKKDFHTSLVLDPQNALARKNFDTMMREMADAATGFNATAANVIIILNSAAENMKNKPPKGPATNRKLVSRNCQDYFRSVGKELAKFRIASWVNDFDGKDADGIVKAISQDAAQQEKEKRRWETLEDALDIQKDAPPEEIFRKAQWLANRGVIVVGGMPKPKKEAGGGYGHLGFVAPIREGLDISQFHEGNLGDRGPFVRDGNEHHPGSKLFASTWGAVKAGNAFVLADTHWYVWVRTMKPELKP